MDAALEQLCGVAKRNSRLLCVGARPVEDSCEELGGEAFR